MAEYIPVVFNIVMTVLKSNNPVLMLPFYFAMALGLVYFFDRLLRGV